MSDLRDEDGNQLVRTRDGDLVPVIEPEPDPLPDYAPQQPCADPDHYGVRALTCSACWSEIHSGERPRRYLGQLYREDSP